MQGEGTPSGLLLSAPIGFGRPGRFVLPGTSGERQRRRLTQRALLGEREACGNFFCPVH